MRHRLHNKLMQLFADNRDKPRQFRAEQGDNGTTIYLYDAIGSYFGISAEEFVRTLNDIQDDTIHLRINSPGGDVFEARAIQTALRQHSANVIAHIDGLAASAATGVSLGANQVEMAEGAFYMIHKAWTLGIGNANDFEELAAMLHKVDGSIARDYERKTGATSEQIVDWMDAETWFTADEAKDNGFIDSVYTGEDVDNHWDLSAYSNTPENLARAPANDPETESAREHRNKLLRRVDMLDAIAV